jgi:hypothetical protein
MRRVWSRLPGIVNVDPPDRSDGAATGKLSSRYNISARMPSR